MNVTATTLPRRSRSDSRALSCVVSVNSGAGPIFDSCASAFASCPVAGLAQPTAASAATMATHHARRRPIFQYATRCASMRLDFSRPFHGTISSLELPFELIEDSPVRALRDELLGVGLDHAALMQAQGVEAQGVLRHVLAPARIGNFPERLPRVLELGRILPFHEKASHAVRLARAEVGRLEERAKCSLCRYRMRAGELPVGRRHAAEILGPWPVGRGVDHDMTDLPRPQLLGLGREPDEGVHAAFV